MAQVEYERLISLVREAVEYKSTIEAGVPVDTAFYIRFAPAPPEGVESDTVELANGCELVLDRGVDGRIYGIEIV